MKKIKIILGLLCLCAFIACNNDNYKQKVYNEGINIIPKPKSLTQNEGSFTLDSKTRFNATDNQAKTIAEFFANKLNTSTGYNIKVSDIDGSNNVISLELNKDLSLNDEGYTLDINKDAVKIVAKNPIGLFYGMQTFMQLLPAEIENKSIVNDIKWEVPAVTVSDEPEFKYRGFMLDVCRHFSTADDIKKHIDIISMFKINRLHLHLTDDQLWAIEIKKYPKLTEIGSARLEGEGNYHKGFLSQEELKDIVKYASERYVEIIPEIELPGHGLAALTAYPEYSCTGGPFNIRNVWGVEEDVYCAGNDATFEFLQNILEEVIPIFPSEYIHIGGDECPKVRWEKCPKCIQRMKNEGLKDTHELQSYFIKRIEKFLNSKGKKIIGWDEILEGGLAPSATVMSWRGEEGGIEAANAEHDVIMTPGEWCYLDKFQGSVDVEPVTIGGYATLEKTYSYNPIPKEVSADKKHHILGVQGNLWTEYMYNDDLREYYAYPKIIAIAEIGWCSPENKNWEDFARRINNAYVRLDAHNINYHIPLPEGPQSDYVAMVDSVSLEFNNTRNYPMVYTLDSSEPTANSTLYNTPITFTDNGFIKIATLLPSGKISKVRTIEVAKETLSPAYEGKTDSGITKKVAQGHYVTREQYSKATYETPVVIDFFTSFKGDAYKNPSIEVYEGYFDVPEDGVYLLASDNVGLYVDDKLVIDNDAECSRHLRKKNTMALAKGKHRFKLVMNNSVIGGWPNVWSANTFYYQAPSSDKLQSVKKEDLSH